MSERETAENGADECGGDVTSKLQPAAEQKSAIVEGSTDAAEEQAAEVAVEDAMEEVAGETRQEATGTREVNAMEEEAEKKMKVEVKSREETVAAAVEVETKVEVAAVKSEHSSANATPVAASPSKDSLVSKETTITSPSAARRSQAQEPRRRRFEEDPLAVSIWVSWESRKHEVRPVGSSFSWLPTAV